MDPEKLTINSVTTPVLTVAIPTFNRTQALITQIKRLLPQLNDPRVYLLVLNNAGDPNLLNTIRPLVEPIQGRFYYHSNVANIGMCANILRTLELAQTSWIWWLGDDDPILADAIKTAFQAIAEADEHTLMIQSGCNHPEINIHRPQKISSLSSLSKLCENSWIISNFLHLSSTIVNRPLALKYLNVGYHTVYSLGPHVAMKFVGVRDGLNILLYPQQMFESGGYDPQSWSRWKLLFGMTSLIELEGVEQELYQSLRSVYRAWLGRPLLIRMLATILRGTDRPSIYWRSYCLRIASVSGFRRGLLFCSLALFICPLLKCDWICSLLKKILGSRKELSSASY
ncbi:MAG: glycosyltransferase family 2 protein [Methylacidiphilales bacterium]|nr:glycosyltransferase family 2 protein [Candidatus Methylacidiphilales bacterium]MDW8349699.1 glycosyltransferase family A protein [Verrucomicrobiae bacterium]